MVKASHAGDCHGDGDVGNSDGGGNDGGADDVACFSPVPLPPHKYNMTKRLSCI